MKLTVHAFLFLSYGIFFQTIVPGRTKSDFLKLYQETVSPRASRVKKQQKMPARVDKKETETATYTFRIKTKNSYRELPWRVYHRGNIIATKNGIFQFVAEKNREHFDIVIAHIKQPEQATIETLEVPNGVPFVHVSIKRAPTTYLEQADHWNVQKNVGVDGFAIPEDALIIQVDSRYFLHLEHQTLMSKESNIIMLPTIVFMDDDSLSETCVKSILTALETDAFHSRPHIEETRNGDVNISHIRYQ